MTNKTKNTYLDKFCNPLLLTEIHVIIKPVCLEKIIKTIIHVYHADI